VPQIIKVAISISQVRSLKGIMLVRQLGRGLKNKSPQIRMTRCVGFEETHAGAGPKMVTDERAMACEVSVMPSYQL